jgi:hypothetical protein
MNNKENTKEITEHELEIGRTYTHLQTGRKVVFVGPKWDSFNQREYLGFTNDRGDGVPFFYGEALGLARS